MILAWLKYSTVPLDLDANVPHSHLDPVTFIRNDITSLLTEFSPCTATEVSSIMSDLKITKVGLNSAPNSLIVTNRDIFATTICDVINKSLLCGIFPDVLKRGQITPIHKKSCNKTPANYRPITISPFLGKVFEKIIYARMIEHINANDILSAHQFGFRKHMSTLDAIIHLTEFIYDALNGKKSSLNILIDYSRAFDTVNHEILLNKLKRYGVQGMALKLLTSYLRDRKQCVRVNNSCSNFITTNISVPQGSVMGPLLFLLYINDLPNLSPNFLPTMFADDCTMSFQSDNIFELINDCNNDLILFKSWSDANRLTINIDKRTVSLFRMLLLLHLEV